VISRGQDFAEHREDANDSGQALVEYALILMLIAFVAFAALEVIGTGISGALSDAASGFGGA